MTSTIQTEAIYTSGVYGKRDVAIVRGSGAMLWDAEGREYIDCVGGYGVANIGHGRIEIASALAEQAQRLSSCPEIFYNDVRARYLERLSALTPSGLDHTFLCNSGTEAIEGAFKFARLATGRTGIIATLRSFHGRTMGALSATWEPHYREPFGPLLPGVSHMRYNNIAAAEAAINEETAAVIVELVQGEGGVHVAEQAYIQGLAALCRERGALLIIDEVQTGFGRTGTLFACAQYDLVPDILCLAKSIAGGVPMGAICLGPRVIESGRMAKGVHGSTFGGNPLACAAALTTLDIIEREQLPQRAATLGAYALERLRAIRSPLIREVRGCGLLLGIELTRRAQSYLEALTVRGVLALQAGPNVIRLLPPLVITQEQLDRVLAVVEEVLTARGEQGDRRGLPYTSSGLQNVGETPAVSIHSEPFPLREGRPNQTAVLTRPTTTAVEPVALLEGILTIPSLSTQEHHVARYLVEQAQHMGLSARIDEAGNFIACTHDDATAQDPIVLLGHMDTVPGNIPVRIENGVLYGRGAVDAKGPLAAFVAATARIAQAREARRPIIVVGAVEEEAATSRGAHAVVSRYIPSACIIGEPSGSHSVTIGYKGRLLVDCSVIRTSHHSASPHRNSSEVAVAFWERVRTHAETWNVAHAPHSSFAALLPTLRGITTSQDGLTEQTQLRIGYRLPPNYDVTALQGLLQQWACEDGLHLEFSGFETAFQAPRNTPVARAFLSALRATGSQPSFKCKTGTSDMNVVGPVWGQNILAYGPGDASLDHTPNEHIHLSEFHHAIDVLEIVLRDLSQQQEVTQ